MERGSDKHSPMLDEALKHETESLRRGEPTEARSEEFRTVSEVWAGLGGRVETPRHLNPRHRNPRHRNN